MERYSPVKVATKNFGDALNPFIGEFFSGKKVINANVNDSVTRDDTVYLVCGSSLTFAQMPTEVWGSAILTPRWNLKAIPKKVHAVRGPLTRKYLLDRGVKCPEVYGDPGLLCPMFFRPSSLEKKYTFGLIPHVVDKKIVSSWDLPEEVLVIDIEEDFQTIVDKLNSCKYILSSSLHGLILSDAYKLSSLYVTISGVPIAKGKSFKFKDYFLSIGKDYYDPLLLTQDRFRNLSKIRRMCREYKLDIDLKKLVDACPFNLKEIKYEQY